VPQRFVRVITVETQPDQLDSDQIQGLLKAL